MNDAITKVSTALDAYKFNEAAKELYDFVWGDFCDWYIEASKVSPNIAVLDEVFQYDPAPAPPVSRRSSPRNLWAGTGEQRHDPIRGVAAAARQLRARLPSTRRKWKQLYELVSAGRQLRNEYGIEPKKKLKFAIKPSADEDFFRAEVASLKAFLNAENVEIDRELRADRRDAESRHESRDDLHGRRGGCRGGDGKRLTKQLADIERQLAATEAKLANENFVSQGCADRRGARTREAAHVARTTREGREPAEGAEVGTDRSGRPSFP